jgi:hypothetical protein
VKQAEELICLYVVDPVMFNFSFLSDIFWRYKKVPHVMFSQQFCETAFVFYLNGFKFNLLWVDLQHCH